MFSVGLEAFQYFNILFRTAFDEMPPLNSLSVKPENVTKCKGTPLHIRLTIQRYKWNHQFGGPSSYITLPSKYNNKKSDTVAEQYCVPS